MTPFVIPITPDTDAWSQLTELDGRTFRLVFDWSRREEAWYLDIYDPDGVALCIGLKLVEGTNLLRREASSAVPGGSLVVYDMTGAHEEPTFEGLGDRWQLFYGAP